ncbi:predicted protein [Phaeodactylum tricornutum CCAP 1055/1]|uniref:Uncharacterized protein n=2 Tax=Phaeodactylum tricornutum TaxID=2850 RepID=B7GA74_PHATC|nr:predicted protein [Phaeodactylum tricornutum CCAP 1055/1]EEC44567.1 predicted protein [Phaeodactylum tricornutum CCAP 1055/1]|eukprot:XP_002183898.1 predicted protein [Phaeodactylum tricornutum CCAP 1055/1]
MNALLRSSRLNEDHGTSDPPSKTRSLREALSIGSSSSHHGRRNILSFSRHGKKGKAFDQFEDNNDGDDDDAVGLMEESHIEFGEDSLEGTTADWLQCDYRLQSRENLDKRLFPDNNLPQQLDFPDNIKVEKRSITKKILRRVRRSKTNGEAESDDPGEGEKSLETTSPGTEEKWDHSPRRKLFFNLRPKNAKAILLDSCGNFSFDFCEEDLAGQDDAADEHVSDSENDESDENSNTYSETSDTEHDDSKDRPGSIRERRNATDEADPTTDVKGTIISGKPSLAKQRRKSTRSRNVDTERQVVSNEMRRSRQRRFKTTSTTEGNPRNLKSENEKKNATFEGPDENLALASVETHLANEEESIHSSDLCGGRPRTQGSRRFTPVRCKPTGANDTRRSKPVRASTRRRTLPPKPDRGFPRPAAADNTGENGGLKQNDSRGVTDGNVNWIGEGEKSGEDRHLELDIVALTTSE